MYQGHLAANGVGTKMSQWLFCIAMVLKGKGAIAPLVLCRGGDLGVLAFWECWTCLAALRVRTVQCSACV